MEPTTPTTVCLDGVSACLTGFVNGSRRVFRGVRYARAARWAPPVAADLVDGAATAFGEGCPQLGPAWGSLRGEGGTSALPPTSEDCLFLNVYAPAAATASSNALATLVFMHGGSFTWGGSWDVEVASAPQLERDMGGTSAAQAAATEGVIYVTVNYRLGALGYLGGDALRALDTQRGATGNYGHMDQREALRWVRAHIAAFGGDPERVTLFGESAGAAGVAAHLTMPASFGLVQRAAMESGGFANWGSKPMADAQAVFDAYATALGCGSVDTASAAPQQQAQQRACLLRQPLTKLLDFADAAYGDVAATKYGRGDASSGSGFDGSAPTSSGLPVGVTQWRLPHGDSAARCQWAPVVDGVELTSTPSAHLARGQIDPSVTHILLGFNRDEGSVSVPTSLSRDVVGSDAAAQAVAAADLRAWLGGATHGIELSSAEVDTVAAAYPVGEGSKSAGGFPASPSAWESANRVLTDFSYVCATLRAARSLEAQQRVAYVYRFLLAPSSSPNAQTSPIPGHGQQPAMTRPYGAFHGAEVPFVWGAAVELTTPAERAAAVAIASAFATFATTGDPNVGLQAAAAGGAAYAQWEAFGTAERTLVLGADASDTTVTVALQNGGAGQAERCVVWDSICETRHGAAGCSIVRSGGGGASSGAGSGNAEQQLSSAIVGFALLGVCIGGVALLCVALALVARARGWCGLSARGGGRAVTSPMGAADYLRERIDDISAAFELACDDDGLDAGGAYAAMPVPAAIEVVGGAESEPGVGAELAPEPLLEGDDIY